MARLRVRLERLEGAGRSGGVYVVRTKDDEREARARASARGDRMPVLIRRLTPPIES